jgi:hypothetical protein
VDGQLASPTLGEPRQADGLPAALRRLDFLLERAIRGARAVHGAGLEADAWRGMYIDDAEIDRLLAREPGEPILWPPGEDPAAPWDPAATGSPRFGALQAAFGLSPRDLDIVLIALAPEIDLRYERLYAYLQDDVTRKQPSIDLVLNILSPTPEEKLAQRRHLLPGAPLIQHGLVRLAPDAAHELGSPICLDEQIVHYLLGHDHLDRRLADCCVIAHPAEPVPAISLSTRAIQPILPLVERAWNGNGSLCLHLFGLHERDRLAVSRVLAGRIDAPLLVADLARAGREADPSELTRLIFREAWLRGCLLHIQGLDTLAADGQRHLGGNLDDRLREDGWLTVLSSADGRLPAEIRAAGIVPIPLPMPDAEQRRACWRDELDAAGIALAPLDIDALASRFRLSPSQIADAGVRATATAATLAPDDVTPRERVFAAARAQAGDELAALTRKLEPMASWDDIVLPNDTLAQLRELCGWVAQRDRVLHEWGFDRKLLRGLGVTALFAGASGTGKTMAAEVIAGELGIDLYRIDLAGVVSKYIGETEKNLDRIFSAAESSNAILLFDEADALFGKRSEVRDAHDRYANIEISYLLQKMEEYDGITILATNLRQNLDDAFTRRLAFTVHFPFPGADDRRRIWASVWPAAVPLSEDVDFDALARGVKLTGGNIRNVALAASYLAAGAGEPVGMAHLRHAIRREFQKMGKSLGDDELIGLLATPGVDAASPARAVDADGPP